MNDLFHNLSLIEMLWFYMPKILVATLCGGVVGIERERKHKAAGMKTNIMVCVGSTLFAATALVVGSLTTGVDPTRMIGQIITGIGFLGAGSIFKDQEKIRGLTSAALIWILGAIGILIALGGYVLSIIMALGLVCLIITVQIIEKKWFNVDEES